MSAGLPFYMREAMFQQWHRDNPLIWEYFKQFSFAALNAGHKHISHWLIINRIRWEVFITTTGKDFKISNDLIAFYARLWRKTYPEHRSLFKIKRMRGEVWSLEDEVDQ